VKRQHIERFIKAMLRIELIPKKILRTIKPVVDERCVFLHVPKCGGTSIDIALNRHYAKESKAHLHPDASLKAAQLRCHFDSPFGPPNIDKLFRFREYVLLYYLSQPQLRFISGHFNFSKIALDAFGEEGTFITVLRNPVERLISLYFFNRYKKSNHFKLNMDIDDYLSSEDGQAQGSLYVRFFNDVGNPLDCRCQATIENAKSNLDRLDIVGCLEHKGLFIKQLEERFKVKIKLRRYNKAVISDSFKETIVTDAIKNRIIEICRPDMEVYQHVIDRRITPYL
jgi:hypothetical protein